MEIQLCRLCAIPQNNGRVLLKENPVLYNITATSFYPAAKIAEGNYSVFK